MDGLHRIPKGKYNKFYPAVDRVPQQVSLTAARRFLASGKLSALHAPALRLGPRLTLLDAQDHGVSPPCLLQLDGLGS